MRWRGESVCIIASGPSLTRADASYARRNLDRVIVINESWRMCPNADVLYGADSTWWMHRGPKPQVDDFTGESWTQNYHWHGIQRPNHIHVIESIAGNALAAPGSKHVFTGHNSAFQALGLAIVWGATEVVFIGLDLQSADGGPNHWHEDYTGAVRNVRHAYPTFIRAFIKAAPMAEQFGVHVVNASRQSALTAFPRLTLAEACAVARARQRGVPETVDPAAQERVNHFFDPDGDGDL